jgi:hypothetical protein
LSSPSRSLKRREASATGVNAANLLRMLVSRFLERREAPATVSAPAVATLCADVAIYQASRSSCHTPNVTASAPCVEVAISRASRSSCHLEYVGGRDPLGPVSRSLERREAPATPQLAADTHDPPERRDLSSVAKLLPPAQGRFQGEPRLVAISRASRSFCHLPDKTFDYTQAQPRSLKRREASATRPSKLSKIVQSY